MGQRAGALQGKKKTLPVGMVFPLDFGFVPNTLADDGDPVDVLVLADEPIPTGCLIACRAIGVLNASQKEKGTRKFRNDRIIAVADCAGLHKNVTKIGDLGDEMKQELETFFITYNRQEGKTFSPLGWKGAREALALIHKSITNY
jgi:inorganic pyrophosphatase